MASTSSHLPSQELELEPMVSSSSCDQHNQEFDPFSTKRGMLSESSRLFDVFINHRGPDVKQTLAIQLYNSLEQLGIRTFLDSQEKQLGDSFASTIQTAIFSASVHVAIFSKGYADSSWCLDELLLMLKSEAKIIPVFYQVKPSDLRYIETGTYAEAFIKYKMKGRYLEKLNQWKEALRSLSLIAGEEFNSSSDWHCQKIVEVVQKEVQRKTRLHVAQYPVGLSELVKDFERCFFKEPVQDFENQCQPKDKVKAIGIFGMGGSGKTTLAKELFNRKSLNYSRTSFLFDVREAAEKGELPSLQLKLLKDLFHRDDLSFTTTEEGTSYLKDSLRRSPAHLRFLIVVDDINHVEQLNALLVMDIFNKLGDSLVIVTTRDVAVLVNVGISDGYCLDGMDKYYGSELFCWHAFDKPNPLSGYEELVNSFVDVCGGIPLSLQVLGRHVHGRSKDYWRSELNGVRKTLPQDVKERLRISFDALKAEEKQIFMDIACFFGGRQQYIAEGVWEESGWNAQHALETLRDKCLIEEEEEDTNLRMHDHLRDLGREMALELRPPYRLWRPHDLKSLGFRNILADPNIRCFHSIFDKSLNSRVRFFIGQSNICVGTAASLLWLELEGDSTQPPLESIPSWIPLQSVQHLKIKCGPFKTLWENHIQAPSEMKTLVIKNCAHLKSLSGISNLEKLVVLNISQFPKLQELKLGHLGCLERITIKNCEHLKLVAGISNLAKLVKLEVLGCWKLEFEFLSLSRMNCLESLIFDKTVKVKYFMFDGCQTLRKIKFCYEKLVELSIRACPALEDLPDFRCLRCMERIMIDRCGKHENLTVYGCPILRSISGDIGVRKLYINDCPRLEELPSLSMMSYLEIAEIYSCSKLQNITLPTTLISLSILSCTHLQRVAGEGDLTKLTRLFIRDCPELETLPSLSSLNCLERIKIDFCNKIQNNYTDNNIHQSA